MSERKAELASIGKAFSFEPVQKQICPHFRKAPFGLFRCMGSTITGKCGHPLMICPIVPERSNSYKKLSDIIEVD